MNMFCSSEKLQCQVFGYRACCQYYLMRKQPSKQNNPPRAQISVFLFIIQKNQDNGSF